MYLYIKRPLDFLCALILLAALSPLLISVYILLKFTLGSAIFVQERGGYKGKIFNIYKFKTMNNKTNSHGTLLPDEDRLTTIGSILRKWSIDELPGLINVLRGEMSLIGPRPQLAEYLELYSPEQKRRHNVLPGITGWAQVNGRNAISWDQKFKLDVWYVDNISFILDIKIAIKTVYKVLKRVDINEEGQATVSRFIGR